MFVISRSDGFALAFNDEVELTETIRQLEELRAERRATPTKSWPAFLGYSAKGVDENSTNFRAWLRWLRYKLGEKWSD